MGAKRKNTAGSGISGTARKKPMTRGQFLKRVGIGVAAVGAGAIGLAKTSRAAGVPSQVCGSAPTHACDPSSKTCSYDIYQVDENGNLACESGLPIVLETLPGYCCGGECVGYRPPWGGDAAFQWTPGAEYPDPLDITRAKLDAFWASRDSPAASFSKDVVRFILFFNPYTFEAGPACGFNPYFPWRGGSGMYDDGLAFDDPEKRWFGTPFEGAPIEMVKRPSDFSGEVIASLDSRTYRVEAERPAGGFELANPTLVALGMSPPVPKTVKIRGWYVKGVRRSGEPGSLVVMKTGIGGELTAGWNTDDRNLIYHLAMAGHDVWYYDLRGHGVSDGTCFLNHYANADDISGSLRQLASGEGLKIITPEGSTLEGSDEAGGMLLPYESAEKTPLILWGCSLGSQVLDRFMGKYVLAKRGTLGSATFEEYYPGDRREDLSSLDVKGIITWDNFDGVLLSDWVLYSAGAYYRNEWVLEGIAPRPENASFPSEEPGAIGLPTFLDSTCFEGMKYWPAHLQFHGTRDEMTSPASSVACFNQEKGLKDLIVFDGTHGGFWGGDLVPYIQAATVKFAGKALSYSGKLNNSERTTLQIKCCEARSLGFTGTKREVQFPLDSRWRRMLRNQDIEGLLRKYKKALKGRK